MDWRQRIVELVLVKQRLHEVDTQGLWEWKLPPVAATEEQLLAAEARLNEAIDNEYRVFLTYASGWVAFSQAIDLLGADDLGQGALWQRSLEMLSYLEDLALQDAGVGREELLPIAVSRDDMDLFVMTNRNSASPGVVIWFAGAEVERFASFEAFFAAMADYNRSEIARLEKRQNAQPS